jgi:23S rRNA pseudouridine955/2504/2580 synthase/23S rRNA pseudouridine1911/1915/1917 synthase
VTKIYEAIVHGTPSEPEGYIDAPMMEHPTIKGKMMVHAKLGKPAQTSYKVITSYGLFSHMQYTLHTGRTHQIRVHTNHIGCPIVCDEVYGNGQPIYISAIKRNYKLAKLEEEERPMLQRLALHAATLQLYDAAGNLISATASLPKDMQAFLNQCAKWLKPL